MGNGVEHRRDRKSTEALVSRRQESFRRPVHHRWHRSFRCHQLLLEDLPSYLPLHLPIVLVSGVIEIILGILLLMPRYSRLAAWGIIALLIAVFPANIHVYHHQQMFPLPSIVHLLRLPLQGVLILWALAYTRR